MRDLSIKFKGEILLSRREMDMSAEHQLSRFLDTYFYPWMRQHYRYNVERKSDKTHQLKGIDVVINTGKENLNVDEKSQLYYINKNLPTFAFEVNFLNVQGQLTMGWLFNNDLETDYYLLIWPSANCEDLKSIKYTDFTVLDCLLIKREKIRNFLFSKGWTSQSFFEEAKKLRTSELYGPTRIKNETDFYLFYSNPEYYKEQPINIVIKKDTLIKLSDQRYNVTKGGVIKFKQYK